MKNLLLLPVAVCLLAILATDVNAQYGYYGGPYGGSPYGGGYYGGGGHYGYGCNTNYTDPRLGYCLKNDCFCGGGMGGCGMGCGMGCGGGGSIMVRVTVGGNGTNPVVQTYCPQIQGCNGYYGNQMRPANPQQQAQQNVSSRYRAPQAPSSRARYPGMATSSSSRPQAKSVSYRYKF